MICKRVLLNLMGIVCLAFQAKAQHAYFDKASSVVNVDSAIYYTQKCIDVASQMKDTGAIIDCSCLLARKFTVKSLYTRAERLIEKCFSYHFVKENTENQGKLFLELGNIYKYEGAYPQSLTCYLKAKKIFEEAFSKQLLATCNVELAEYYRKIGKYKHAREFIEQSLSIYNKNRLTDTSLLIRIYNRAAAIENESNPDPASTLRNSKIALELAKRNGDKYAEATSLNELGFTCKNRRLNDSAEYFYKKAEEIWFSIGADREAVNAMNNRAMLYLHNGYSEKAAIGIYNDIIKMVNEKKVEYQLEDAYGYLFNEYRKTRDTGAALNYLYQYHQQVVANMTKRNDLAVTNITEKYESENAKKEIVRVSGELTTSKAQNRKMFLFIGMLALPFIVIAVLLWRLKKTNSILNERNKEKDVLIQEIHHRVKNNLQFISSLINMQINSSADSKEIHTLHDASRRIRAMGLVHEMLYNHKDSQGISVKKYLEELILSLDQLVNSDRIPIEFKLQIDEVNFNVSDSIALGMITSELISNSMKHAFRNVEKPEIEVTLRKEEKRISFGVRDNGSGEGLQQNQKKTLGLRLIDIFSRQLKGKYAISANSGCSYELNFNLR